MHLVTIDKTVFEIVGGGGWRVELQKPLPRVVKLIKYPLFLFLIVHQHIVTSSSVFFLHNTFK